MTLKDFLNSEDKFASNNGIQLTEIKSDYAKAQLKVTKEHKNAGGICQGGALFTSSRTLLILSTPPSLLNDSATCSTCCSRSWQASSPSMTRNRFVRSSILSGSISWTGTTFLSRESDLLRLRKKLRRSTRVNRLLLILMPRS